MRNLQLGSRKTGTSGDTWLVELYDVRSSFCQRLDDRDVSGRAASAAAFPVADRDTAVVPVRHQRRGGRISESKAIGVCEAGDRS